MEMPDAWSNIEVELIVADYFNMLIDELTGNPLNKAEHRRKILPLLKDRSNGSIEFKHQNISAVLIRLGQPFISGYLPRFNYQQILEEKVIEYLSHNLGIEKHFKQFVEDEIPNIKKKIDFPNIRVEPPQSKNMFSEPSIPYKKNPIKINYLEKEQRNRNLGIYGEEIILEYEKWSLISLDKEKLAEQIEWVSKDVGDGSGFDILSKNLNGTDKYIEVKTTRLGKETPFYFSNNELNFSIKKSSDYHLYRLFNANNNVKMFIKKGAINKICYSTPIMFKGYF
ncbi:MAG: DUF3883 domain-containing protein [Bacteroidales bacterium]|nr:DUF3883 domain-containing protein [Bacteroidales bacterium]